MDFDGCFIGSIFDIKSLYNMLDRIHATKVKHRHMSYKYVYANPSVDTPEAYISVPSSGDL